MNLKLPFGLAGLPLLGLSATFALVTLGLYVPEVTMVWLPTVAVAVVCAYFLSRFPLRRLAPSDLLSAALGRNDFAEDLPACVDRQFAPRFIRPLPELAIVAACSVIVSRACGSWVGAIFAEEVTAVLLQTQILAVVCALIAGHAMLRCQTNEFVLRARQSPAWLPMLGARTVLLCCFLPWLLPFSRLEGVTERIPKIQFQSDYKPRWRALARHVSQSGNVSVEVWPNEAGKREICVRDRRNLRDIFVVGTYDAGVIPLLSFDDRWLAVTYPQGAENAVMLFEREKQQQESNAIRYLATSDARMALSERVKSFYLTSTNDRVRSNQGRASVTASGWSSMGDKLTLSVTFNGLNYEQQVEPWLCTYAPTRNVLEAVSSAQVIDRATRARVAAADATLEERGKVMNSSPAELPRRDSYPGERHSETRLRLLTEGEVADWSVEKLRYAINEMFARHGADLVRPELNQWFAQYNWRTMRRGVDLEILEANEFSDIERQNLKLLGGIRDRKKGQR